MATTAGALSQVSVSSTSAQLLSAVATAGTAPYTYQWYRSTTSAFSPGVGSLIAGATALSLNDTGLIPNTQYYYKVVATDSGAVAGNSSQLAVSTTATTLNPNSFGMSTVVGAIDMNYNYDTVAVQIDSSQATALYAGAAVKIVDSAGGVPKVIGVAANSDEVLGFLNFNIKNVSYNALDAAEISMAGNVVYLYATGAIARGVQVSLDISTMGGVRAAAGNTGDDIVGFAFDKAAAAGDLIRVKLSVPSFLKV